MVRWRLPIHSRSRNEPRAEETNQASFEERTVTDVAAGASHSAVNKVKKGAGPKYNVGSTDTLQPSEVRKLRELIQLRYSLDISIWSDRGIQQFARNDVEQVM